MVPVDESTVRLHSSAFLPVEPSPKVDFWEVLRSFENQTLWRYFHCEGDGRWIHEGLLMGTLVIVHDGSYMPHVAKDVCSAAFMIYCTSSK